MSGSGGGGALNVFTFTVWGFERRELFRVDYCSRVAL